MRYFPDALLAVAELSLYGNEKHNPGEDLHWSREKSSDHADCAARHLLEPLGVDMSYGPEKPVLHSVAAAWRSLANAQVEIEELRKQGKWPLSTAPKHEPADATGWRPWGGGEQAPVDPDVPVLVRFRNGDESEDPDIANAWYWEHDHESCDIVAYKVVDEVTPE